MDSENFIKDLENLKKRLREEVRDYYAANNTSLGDERLKSWFRLAEKLLTPLSPELYIELKTRPIEPMFRSKCSNTLEEFDTYAKKPLYGFIDSLILDIRNNEFELPQVKPIKDNKESKLLKKAFIVHGHDEATKFKIARFLEKLGFDAIILHEQANGGKTIIEKLEHFTDVGFGIVLYTPDDEGSVKDKKIYQPRARQNVVFEHGLLIGKLGREKVFPLVSDHSVELPGDINGMVYLSDTNWELQLAKELRELGYEIDMNQVV